MAAPTPTTRVVPPGYQMKDGYRSLITFAADPNILLWELAVTPPSIDGGEPIPTSNMFTGTYHTKEPRQLIMIGDNVFRCHWHPLVWAQIEAITNVKTTVTQTYSTGHYTAFFGYLRLFQPGELAEGSHPEATVTIVCTNWDPTNNVEAGPVTGTSS